MKTRILQPSFVKFIPESLEDGIIYISIDYCTATHNCVCGCGNKVVTPFTPTDWELAFNGETVSLSPSIGNWSFDCQSHYWIKRGKIQWAGQWSQEEIEAGRRKDQITKQLHFSDVDEPSEVSAKSEFTPVEQEPVLGFWQKLRHKFGL
ncbi:DUF6527 family protein [Spirosoma oryzicola]|uniref:DUF6527 family protein n=1 Tax=Spirosoma oryzicola TaxID=2898794 RepID=UPI001E5D01C3|nr:DUF6527 family protein [Spirosoma oryzicola]UHG94681.1 hypothetical protein LQ777_29225 [Spirosoma oryzicola]